MGGENRSTWSHCPSAATMFRGCLALASVTGILTAFFVFSSPSTLVYEVTPPVTPHERAAAVVSVARTKADTSPPPKIILLWTKLFANRDWWFGLGQAAFTKRCSVWNCLLTDDRNQLAKADAVLVHFRDDWKSSDLPHDQRKPEQYWTFVLWESPYHTYDWVWRSSLRASKRLKPLAGFFNWTMTYRIDSDIDFTYGKFERIALGGPDGGRPHPPEYYLEFDFHAGRKKPIAWMVSHCDTPSRREKYVAELQRHIVVDIYGKCGTLVCKQDKEGVLEGTTDECTNMLERDYFFYFAAENSLCEDYLTEKIWRTLEWNIIPVIFHGTSKEHLERILPDDTSLKIWIDANDYKTPEALANYLNQVMNDKTLYNSYFHWKSKYRAMNLYEKHMFSQHICDVCAKLHDPDIKPKVYTDIHKWWMVDAKCRTELNSSTLDSNLQ